MSKAFHNWLSGWYSTMQSDVHVCLEATGTYGQALALFLHHTKCRVSVVNPAAVKAFAGASLSRTKTDKVDAELIARFCLAKEPAQ
jgi:transposase